MWFTFVIWHVWNTHTIVSSRWIGSGITRYPTVLWSAGWGWMRTSVILWFRFPTNENSYVVIAICLYRQAMLVKVIIRAKVCESFRWSICEDFFYCAFNIQMRSFWNLQNKPKKLLQKLRPFVLQFWKSVIAICQLNSNHPERKLKMGSLVICYFKENSDEWNSGISVLIYIAIKKSGPQYHSS